MPEPPKITTSLADRIARLNATQAHSLDRNHAQVQEQIGEIKSKISKYEATGQHEAPLIPKGSFGLGAPLTKPDRGLDRMRIASLGVSGGTTVSIKSPSNSLSASTGPARSVSLGRPDSRRLSNLSSSDQPSHQSSPTHSPSQPHSSELLPTPPQESQDSLGEQGAAKTKTTTEEHQDPPEDQEANNSFDSGEAYDGILDGYPTTPAEEDCPPMVTCSNCSRSVELELLGDHVCEQSLPPSKAQSPIERSPEGSRRPPADVPVDAVESPALVISQDHPEEPPKDQQLPLSPSSSVCSSSKRTRDPSTTTTTTTTTTATTNTHLSPTAGPPEPLRPPTPVICNKEKDLDSTHQSNKQGSPEILSPKEPQLHANNRLSDSSHSTNTTRLSTGPIPPSSASAGRRSWYNDDDDPDYYDNENAPTGFVTIVRSSKRI